ncbi:MAG: hypothetical protein D6776_00845, partial [Planctomycetota bacterium]
MRNPDEEVAPLLARAVAAAGRGAWDEALQLVDRAIEEAPGRAEPLLTRARLLRASGRDPASALRALRRAIRCVQEPSRRAEVLAEYARALEPIGRYREAAAAFEEAIAHLASQPDGGGTRRLELLDLAARAHERAGHLEQALERHRAAR